MESGLGRAAEEERAPEESRCRPLREEQGDQERALQVGRGEDSGSKAGRFLLRPHDRLTEKDVHTANNGRIICIF